MTHVCYALFGAAVVLLAAGCGSLRQTWVCKDVKVGAKPRTQQKYAIRSLAVSFGEKHCAKCTDAVTADAAEDCTIGPYVVSRKWVDCLYELHPDVFDRKGTPVDIMADKTYLPDEAPGFERSGARTFWGSIGFLTLFPIVPVETVYAARWRITVFDSAGKPSETTVDHVSENLLACSPLGLFCFYAPNGKGHVQTVSGNAEAHGSEDLRRQMEAIGLSIAGELAKLESSGRIRIRQSELGGMTPSQPTNVEDVVRRMLDSKRKELEDLKKAGIIDEAEFAAEMEKLEGAEK